MTGVGNNRLHPRCKFRRGVDKSADDEDRDLVFIQDCTGSQGSYITSSTKNIEEISQAIIESGKLQFPEDLRLGLIAFRDHPPQDHTYVTKSFGFTSGS